MSNKTIVLQEYCKYMYGRYRSDGDHSAQAFREDVLIPEIEQNGTVTVDITMDYGLASSCLEEAFGGLVRETEWDADEVLKRVNIVSEDDVSVNSAITFIKGAKK
ncbi:STAS-like domain-containing protein [Vibrio rotiferianus]|uniref:STAS-like domain-containing protein n=1 Tax=Vibrio harveyi group TaxID=717610 RepID=UPI0005EF00F2|nr:DUF4325 domain-containing protein [Vibrio jasicida]